MLCLNPRVKQNVLELTAAAINRQLATYATTDALNEEPVSLSKGIPKYASKNFNNERFPDDIETVFHWCQKSRVTFINMLLPFDV